MMKSISQEKLSRIMQKIVFQCMGYRKGEKILLVSDDLKQDLAELFYQQLKRLGIEPVLIRIAPRKIHGEEPPPEVAEALKFADIALLITDKSLSHTRARQEASHKYGTRISSLPSITWEIFKRSIDIDYKKLKMRVRELAKIFNSSQRLEIKTAKGTNLRMSIKGRKALEDNGLYTKRGSFGNLPAGEVCIAPREGTTQGILVVDASFSSMGRLAKPITIEIKDGQALRISDTRLRKALSGLGKSAFNIAEFGLGLNPKAIVTGNVLEDEKALNTAHIALGDNVSFGGKVKAPCHLDGVFFKPMVYLDGKKLSID